MCVIIYIKCSLLFCCLQSLTASHSVGANVQRVLSLMKTHNMALCNGLDHQASRSSSPSSGSSSSSSIDTDLAELLLQLQDEFGQMSWSVIVYMWKISVITFDVCNSSLIWNIFCFVLEKKFRSFKGKKCLLCINALSFQKFHWKAIVLFNHNNNQYINAAAFVKMDLFLRNRWVSLYLCFSEHQELSHEISEATDPQIREDLERELDALVTRMEGKSQQISKIRRHQNKVIYIILVQMT